VVVAIGAVTAMLVPAVRRSHQRKGEGLAVEATDAAPGEGADAAVELVGGPGHQPEGAGGADGADGLQPALACSVMSVDSR
jgi:hypothetical protein